MNLVEIKYENIHLYEVKFDEFFCANLSSYKYFHPHEFEYEVLCDILKNSQKDFYGIIEENGKIIGYGMLRGWDEGYEIPSLGIIIDREYRGEGLGFKMMDLLENKAREKGATKIRLTVLKENSKAIHIYKKLGYEISDLNDNNYLGIKKL